MFWLLKHLDGVVLADGVRFDLVPDRLRDQAAALEQHGQREAAERLRRDAAILEGRVPGDKEAAAEEARQILAKDDYTRRELFLANSEPVASAARFPALGRPGGDPDDFDFHASRDPKLRQAYLEQVFGLRDAAIAREFTAANLEADLKKLASSPDKARALLVFLSAGSKDNETYRRLAVPAAVPYLLDIARDSDLDQDRDKYWVRLDAIRALGEIGDAGAQDVLRHILGSVKPDGVFRTSDGQEVPKVKFYPEREEVRRAALDALLKLPKDKLAGQKDLYWTIEYILWDKKDNPEVRMALLEKLPSMAAAGLFSDRQLGDLMRVLSWGMEDRDNVRGVRSAMARVLGPLAVKRVYLAMQRLTGATEQQDKNDASYDLTTAQNELTYVRGTLQGLLGNKSGDLRAEAAQGLAAIGDKESLESLFDAASRLEKGDPLQPTLGEIFMKILADSQQDEQIRGKAAENLGRLKFAGSAGLLRQLALDDGTPGSARFWSIMALSDLGDREFVPELIKLLEHKDSNVRLAVLQALARLPDERAVAPLIAMVSSGTSQSDIYFAAQALGAIGAAGVSKATDFLLGLLDDPDPALRKLGLANLPLEAMRARLDQFLAVVSNGKESADVREAAMYQLRDLLIAGQVPDRNRVIDTLTAAARDSDPQVREAGLDVLRQVLEASVREGKGPDSGILTALLRAFGQEGEWIQQWLSFSLLQACKQYPDAVWTAFQSLPPNHPLNSVTYRSSDPCAGELYLRLYARKIGIQPGEEASFIEKFQHSAGMSGNWSQSLAEARNLLNYSQYATSELEQLLKTAVQRINSFAEDASIYYVLKENGDPGAAKKYRDYERSLRFAQEDFRAILALLKARLPEQYADYRPQFKTLTSEELVEKARKQHYADRLAASAGKGWPAAAWAQTQNLTEAFARGVGKEVLDMFNMAKELVQHPIDTTVNMAKGLWTAVTHPDKVIEYMWDSWANADDEGRMEIMGRITTMLATMAAGTEVMNAIKTGFKSLMAARQTARLARQLGKAARLIEELEMKAARVEELQKTLTKAIKQKVREPEILKLRQELEAATKELEGSTNKLFQMDNEVARGARLITDEHAGALLKKGVDPQEIEKLDALLRSMGDTERKLALEYLPRLTHPGVSIGSATSWTEMLAKAASEPGTRWAIDEAYDFARRGHRVRLEAFKSYAGGLDVDLLVETPTKPPRVYLYQHKLVDNWSNVFRKGHLRKGMEQFARAPGGERVLKIRIKDPSDLMKDHLTRLKNSYWEEMRANGLRGTPEGEREFLTKFANDEGRLRNLILGDLRRQMAKIRGPQVDTIQIEIPAGNGSRTFTFSWDELTADLPVGQ